MIENFKEYNENFKDYDSELLLKILNKTSIETKENYEEELFVDENWIINSKNIDNIIPSENSNLKEYYQKVFQIKKYLFRITMMIRKLFSYPKILILKSTFGNLFNIYCLQEKLVRITLAYFF